MSEAVGSRAEEEADKDNADVEFDEAEARSYEVFMSCIQMDMRLGIAYFNKSTRELFVTEIFEDPSTALGFHGLQLLKYQVQPHIIYASSKSEERLQEALREPVLDNGPQFEVKIVRSGSFGINHAMQRLMCLRTSEVPQDLDADRWKHRLSTMMSLSRELQVRAAGALLTALHNEMVVDCGPRHSRGQGADGEDDIWDEEDEGEEELDGTRRESAFRGGGVTVRRVSELRLERFLTIDATSHEALQIFQTERHPSTMGLGKSKEGFSVFGMLNKCVTSRGRQLLRLWFMRPILDLAELEDRQNTIEFFCTCGPDVVRAILGALKRIKDVPKLLQKMGSPSALSSCRDWQHLQESLNALVELRQYMEVAVSQLPVGCSAASTPVDILPQVAAALNEGLAHARDLVCGVIDLNQSCGMRTDTIVAQGICEELDELKDIFEGLPDFLYQVMEVEKANWSNEFTQHVAQEHARVHHMKLQMQKLQQQRGPQYVLPSPRGPSAGGMSQGNETQGSQPATATFAKAHWGLAMKYFPQVGYLLLVPGPEPIPKDLMKSLQGFDFAFAGEDDSGERCQFYHTPRTRDLDERLGDIFHKISDMESIILRDLTTRLLEHHGDNLLAAAAVAARIDCLLSLALCAMEFKLMRPQLTDKNLLCISGGRHLLQELAVDTFVPNDTVLREKNGRILVLTGPNFSGKSVYVKQVAIIVFLAHIGSFVPATSAVVGLTDRIFTRVASREVTSNHKQSSLTERQSTFALDVKQVVAMMRHATASSLCILDEFGKGTLAADGVGLSCAVVSHLAAWEVPPKMLLCTHFGQIADPAFLAPSPQVAFYTMSILDPQQQEKVCIRNSSTSPGTEARGQGAADPSRVDPPLDEGITFLYRVTLGRTLESYGLHCASLAGVPEVVIQRAREIEWCMRRATPIPRCSGARLAARDAQYKRLADALRSFDPSKESAWAFINRIFPKPCAKPTASTTAHAQGQPGKHEDPTPGRFKAGPSHSQRPATPSTHTEE